MQNKIKRRKETYMQQNVDERASPNDNFSSCREKSRPASQQMTTSERPEPQARTRMSPKPNRCQSVDRSQLRHDQGGREFLNGEWGEEETSKHERIPKAIRSDKHTASSCELGRWEIRRRHAAEDIRMRTSLTSQDDTRSDVTYETAVLTCPNGLLVSKLQYMTVVPTQMEQQRLLSARRPARRSRTMRDAPSTLRGIQIPPKNSSLRHPSHPQISARSKLNRPLANPPIIKREKKRKRHPRPTKYR